MCVCVCVCVCLCVCVFACVSLSLSPSLSLSGYLFVVVFQKEVHLDLLSQIALAKAYPKRTSWFALFFFPFFFLSPGGVALWGEGDGLENQFQAQRPSAGPSAAGPRGPQDEGPASASPKSPEEISGKMTMAHFFLCCVCLFVSLFFLLMVTPCFTELLINLYLKKSSGCFLVAAIWVGNDDESGCWLSDPGWDCRIKEATSVGWFSWGHSNSFPADKFGLRDLDFRPFRGEPWAFWREARGPMEGIIHDWLVFRIGAAPKC